MQNVNIPSEYGSIDIDESNKYLPYTASYDGNVIGNFESFSKALLALVIVNSNQKKKAAFSSTSQESSSMVDQLYYSTLSQIDPHYYPDSLPETSNFNQDGNLVIGFSGVEKKQPKIHRELNLDYDNPLMNLTFSEVYERWFAEKSKTEISQRTLEAYKLAYKKLSHLYDRIFVTIRYSEVFACVQHEQDIGNGFSMRKKMKLFFSQLYQWAIAHEMCTNNIALNIKLGKNENEKHHQPFTLDQIRTLFDHVHEDSFIEEVLMLIFNGCRISEFLNIKREDINMVQRYFIVTESKTKSGRGRMVPIHKKVMKFYRKRLRAKSEWLIHDSRGRKMDYETFSKKFKKLMRRFGWKGMSIHGCRHTLTTMLHSFGADPVTSRYILGHVQNDIHSRVYTHVVVADIHKAMACIK